MQKTSNKTQSHVRAPEINDPTTASPGDTNTPDAQEEDFKSGLMKMIEILKEEIHLSKKYGKIPSNR